MTMAGKKIKTYKYRGMIERGSPNVGYRWLPGYSEDGPSGGILYPWSTFRECQREARIAGCRAVFVKEGETTTPLTARERANNS